MSGSIELDALAGEERKALERLILTLADSKRMMGIRYSDWLLGAPSIEAGIAASSMTQDEWGHARLLYAMLKGLGIDPAHVEHDRPSSAYASVAALDEQFPDWAAAVAAMVVVDGALSVALEAFSRGSFEQARTRVPKMLAEEEFHISLGQAWFRRLAHASDEARGLLTQATEAMLPTVLAWLGAADAPAQALVALGITDAGPVLVGTFRDAVREVLAEAGIDVDTFAASGEWDESRARTPGQPDEESVERARGDRNRALFVE